MTYSATNPSSASLKHRATSICFTTCLSSSSISQSHDLQDEFQSNIMNLLHYFYIMHKHCLLSAAVLAAVADDNCPATVTTVVSIIDGTTSLPTFTYTGSESQINTVSGGNSNTGGGSGNKGDDKNGGDEVSSGNANESGDKM